MNEDRWDRPKLTAAEVDAYITRMSASAMPEPEKSEFLERNRAWGKADDGESFYLANLLRENNPIKPWPGVNIPPASPQATNDVIWRRSLRWRSSWRIPGCGHERPSHRARQPAQD